TSRAPTGVPVLTGVSVARGLRLRLLPVLGLDLVPLGLLRRGEDLPHLGAVLLVQRVRLLPPLLEDCLHLVLLLGSELQAGIDLLELGLDLRCHVGLGIGVGGAGRDRHRADHPAGNALHVLPPYLRWKSSVGHRSPARTIAPDRKARGRNDTLSRTAEIALRNRSLVGAAHRHAGPTHRRGGRGPQPGPRSRSAVPSWRRWSRTPGPVIQNSYAVARLTKTAYSVAGVRLNTVKSRFWGITSVPVPYQAVSPRSVF